MTRCSYTRTTFESHFPSSAPRTHVQDDKDTIRSPRSSAILGPNKKTKKSSIYKWKKKQQKNNKKNTGKFFSSYPITPGSTLHALDSSSFSRVVCYFPPHPPPLSTWGPSWHGLYLLAFDCPLPFPLLLASLLISRIPADLWLEYWSFCPLCGFPNSFRRFCFFD